MFRYKFKRQRQTRARKQFEEDLDKKIPMWMTTMFTIYIVIFLGVFIWFFWFKSTYYISDIYNVSMQPTLNADISGDTAQDSVYVNTRARHKHGDIITISKKPKNVIKRLIAMEGDKVSIVVGEDNLYHVSIIYNGEQNATILEEDYIKSAEEWRYSGKYFQAVTDGERAYEKVFHQKFLEVKDDRVSLIDGIYYYEVPKDSYFCLGDNRALSSDSRENGVFLKKDVTGVAQIIIKNGAIHSGLDFWKKFSAVFMFYWSKIEDSFAR